MNSFLETPCNPAIATSTHLSPVGEVRDLSPQHAPQNLVLPNGVELQLLWRGEQFLGIGRVEAHGNALRAGRRPMFVAIRNPNGVELSDFRLVSCQQTDDSLTLELQPHVQEGGPMEWQLHEVRSRLNTSDWTKAPEPATDTRLWLEIKAVTRQLGAHVWQGFSYRYRYQSQSVPIYRILDRGTWEIGGKASGSEFWLRHGARSIVRFEPDSQPQHFSTEWYLPGIANPNIFQFQPWQTQFQGLTFTASHQGLLATFASDVAHIRSLFEKPRGSDEIVHLHEHCADLENELTTSPIEVLGLAGEFDRVDRFNRYEEVRAWLHTELHAQIGMREEKVTTYGLIEEWGEADMDRYRRLGVPKLLDAGIETVALANHFQNNMNTWGVSNMCCNVDFKFSETMGQEIKKLSADVMSGGSRVEMWGNTAISTLNYIFDNREHTEKADPGKARIKFLPREDSIMDALDEAQSPWVRNTAGAVEADHYSPVFVQLNLRDSVVRDYWMKRWLEAKTEFGISGIFLDSSFNMSSDKFSYHYEAVGGEHGATIDQTHLLGYGRPCCEPRQSIESQYFAHLSLMVEMQRAGYQICGEDVGVFGLSRSGPGIAMRLDNLPLWQDGLIPFDSAAIEKAGHAPDDVFFKALAYRQMWILYWHIEADCLSFDLSVPIQPTAWHLALLKTFRAAASVMNCPDAVRSIWAGERAVEYRVGDQRVLWTFEEVTVEIQEQNTFTDLQSGEVFTASGASVLPRHRVFQIGGAS